MSDLVLPNRPTAEQIDRLQDAVLQLPQAEPITTHYFADGMYCRTTFRKAGTVVIGKVHKKEHIVSLIEGEMSLWTEEGIKTVKAPFVWVSKPGTKRVTYAHTDATLMTVHMVSSRDIDEIERELVEDDPKGLFGPGNVPIDRLLEEVA